MRKDIFKIPANNILKRWTRQAKEGFDDISCPSLNSEDMDDSAARQNILYIVAVDAVKEICQCKSMLGKSLQVFRELKREAIAKRNEDATMVLQENHCRPDDGNVTNSCQNLDLQPPKRVKSKGRPKTVRLKSKLEYVKVFGQKNKPVASLYGNENSQPCKINDHSVTMEADALRSPSGKQIKCGRCKTIGHNRKTCSLRGI